MKAWSKEETLKRFEQLLIMAKGYYKTLAEDTGTWYSDTTDVTNEELRMACTNICLLGDVAWQNRN